MPDTAPLTGRCYCGAVSISAPEAPLTVATCHCADCRRVSGAPSNTFAAFAQARITFTPALDDGTSHTPGVRRWSCAACSTPLAATYDYLPDQIYVPVGLFDQVDALVPQSESHTAGRVRWIRAMPGLPQSDGTGRKRLGKAHDDG